MRRFRGALVAATFVVAAAGCFFAPPAVAQSQQQQQPQESGLLDRLDHPDRTLHYSPSDKEFAVSSSVGSHPATVRAFAFSHPATLRAGDGAFRTNAFNGTDGFRTKDFATRADPRLRKDFAQTNRQYGTKGYDVREDRAANKSMPVRDYIPAGKPYLVPGKRQDSIDELRKQKNLTVDQVREILNKSR